MATYHLRLKNDTKANGTKISAKGHADYILREGEENQTDCIYKSCQLPNWADGSAQKFFRAAEKYEDKGNRRYKEIEMSLPNELKLEQNMEIVNAFIAKHLSNHYYALAIHEKAGAISEEKHPHVHIMFSERLIDEVERERTPSVQIFQKSGKTAERRKRGKFSEKKRTRRTKRQKVAR